MVKTPGWINSALPVLWSLLPSWIRRIGEEINGLAVEIKAFQVFRCFTSSAGKG
jgi:hypothetical protein